MEVLKVLSASTIRKDSVENPQGEDLGNIEDIVVDLDSGMVAYTVLSFGGILGIGDKYFAVPWDALRKKTGEHKFIVDIDKEKLENAPGFDKENWPGIEEKDYREHVNMISEYYGYKPYWERVRETPAEKETSTRRTHRTALAASDIKGISIENPQGEDLGNIEDIMIDLDSGMVAYTVLSFGGFLGIGEKYFAIPWEALGKKSGENKFIINVDKEKLKNAPGFDKDNWPRNEEKAHREYVNKISEYYGYKPYWDTA
ncbi:PRC-barrel domain-containing protein [Methanolobus psychrotolerans]|uniref:PRC-barrel domain-containing protein n=1 Tax=Methanolobus psychrotolerans TaxID=1874706 RepID=UPI000B91A0EA|nr:PRC-barrel domain-containing protein [Methanolobus psychrotolerans]